jgi:GNAT superfamily N-acetyltransferase
MRVRTASESDIPEMHRIRMSVRENRLTDPASVQPHHYRAMLGERGVGWIAEVEGRAVGFAVVDLARANLWALFVDPSFEGKGIGRRLHDAVMEWVFAAGGEQVWLSTDPGTRAERFYRSARWQPAGREPSGEARFVMTRERWFAHSPTPPLAPDPSEET